MKATPGGFDSHTLPPDRPIMPLIPVADLDDPRLASYRHLKATNATRWRDDFIVEGPKLVGRLARSRFPLLCKVHTQQVQHDYLGRKTLGGANADFDTGPDEDAEVPHGFGLTLIVSALAESLVVTHHPTRGKTVTATFTIRRTAGA